MTQKKNNNSNYDSKNQRFSKDQYRIQDKNRNKSFIPWIFVIFFSIFIVVDIIYITIANNSWRGLAIKDGYQKGLKYNETIKAVQTQKNLGWELEIKYKPKESKSGILMVELFNKDNKKIKDASLIAKIKRPIQEGKDFEIYLKFNAQKNHYYSEIEFPVIGQWDIEVIAKKSEDIYQDVKRIIIR